MLLVSFSIKLKHFIKIILSYISYEIIHFYWSNTLVYLFYIYIFISIFL